MAARFWTYWNDSWVKITVREELILSRFQWTDEGWSRDTERYELADDGLYCECLSEGRDCDGRSESYNTSFCPLDRLKANPPDEYRPYPTPAWQRVDASQRDYTAEAAGY